MAACLDEPKVAGGNWRTLGESRAPPDVFKLCIDFDVAIRLRASVLLGVPGMPFTGVSPSTTIAIRLWLDILFERVLRPILSSERLVQPKTIWIGRAEVMTYMDRRSSTGRLGTKLGRLATRCIVRELASDALGDGAITMLAAEGDGTMPRSGKATPMPGADTPAACASRLISFWSIRGELSRLLGAVDVLPCDDEDDDEIWYDWNVEYACCSRICCSAKSDRSMARSRSRARTSCSRSATAASLTSTSRLHLSSSSCLYEICIESTSVSGGFH